jgi:hypothetical protein
LNRLGFRGYLGFERGDVGGIVSEEREEVVNRGLPL